MAKRRKLTAPSTEDLTKLEAEFSGGAPSPMIGGRNIAPISQVAAEAAAELEVASTEARAKQAKLEADAEALETAQAEGRLLLSIPTDQIDADAMIRDRAVVNEEENEELRKSILANGLRLPIEVFEFQDTRSDGKRYGLISGYRRLQAVRALATIMGPGPYDAVKTLVHPTADRDKAVVAMVEENEVRAELSQFERGRIAVIATHQGVFVNIEEAVNKLYASASKAKRSKVRSFAMIFEELGDMLSFPQMLSEKKGLQIAQGLRNGLETALRDALAKATVETPAEEWDIIDRVLQANADLESDPKRGGRPKAKKPLSGWSDEETLVTSSGITIRRGQDEKGALLRFEGRHLDAEFMETLMLQIKNMLE